METPHTITPKILNYIQEISVILGKVNSSGLQRVQPELRKKNKIRTIHSTLAIEGNTLSQDEITKIIDQKWVKGPKDEIIEVLNAIEVYDQLAKLNPHSENSFKQAHKLLTNKLLVKDSGKYRMQEVGVGNHIAPSHKMVPTLMKNLFDDLKKSKLPETIKSCIFHYEHLFIHPFLDGNGRMGRLWQTLILTQYDPIFEFIPIENFIKDSQQQYYKVLRECDTQGNATPFIEFMLEIIKRGLHEFVGQKSKPLTNLDRLSIARKHFSDKQFSRKDYMKLFHNISQATATRDLRTGVDKKKLTRMGMNRNSLYIFIS